MSLPVTSGQQRVSFVRGRRNAIILWLFYINFKYQFCEGSRSGAEEVTLGSNLCGICSLVLEFDVLKRL